MVTVGKKIRKENELNSMRSLLLLGDPVQKRKQTWRTSLIGILFQHPLSSLSAHLLSQLRVFNQKGELLLPLHWRHGIKPIGTVFNQIPVDPDRSTNHWHPDPLVLNNLEAAFSPRPGIIHERHHSDIEALKVGDFFL
jgi:hypothetical protein